MAAARLKPLSASEIDATISRMAEQPRNKRVSVQVYFFAIISLFSVVTLFLNAKHGGHVEEVYKVSAVADTLMESFTRSEPSTEVEELDPLESLSTAEGYNLAGLSCEAYGGPSEEIAREMVYWEDIPSDANHVSPYKKQGVQQYLTFEPDKGGWNNIRMAMETVLAIAFAMGRTLVLPPEQPMYLLRKAGASGKKQRTDFSFNHFFHMEAIHNEHPGLSIITMEEFLVQEAMTGKFRDSRGKVSFPPGNRTHWDGAKPKDVYPLYTWLRRVSHMTVWNEDECLAVFPASGDPKDIETLESMKETIVNDEPKFEDYIGKPTPVDAPTIERMRENWGGRSKLCMYDEKMQAAPLVHFPVSKQLNARLLVHFYALLFFQDWKQDLWMKRFVRDHVRYVDEIQCVAARVVHAVREHAREHDPSGNPEGLFDTFHVRRGDFQYRKTRVSATELYEQGKTVIPDNATVFIATDERDKTFFAPMMAHYDVVFLDDFAAALGDTNTNYYGMIDQLVASRGRFFFGCWFSTFTGYINRLRGYHTDEEELPGYKEGIIDSWYYALRDRYDHMRTYYPIKRMFYAREFPTSWRLIDTGIDAPKLESAQ